MRDKLKKMTENSMTTMLVLIWIGTYWTISHINENLHILSFFDKVDFIQQLGYLWLISHFAKWDVCCSLGCTENNNIISLLRFWKIELHPVILGASLKDIFTTVLLSQSSNAEWWRHLPWGFQSVVHQATAATVWFLV